MPFCVNCGAQNPEGAKFCANCGKPVAEVVASAEAQPTPAEQAAQSGAPVPTPPAPPAGLSTKLTGTPQTLLYAAAAIFLLGGVLQLLGGDIWAILAFGLVALIYFAAVAPLQKGNKAAARNGAMIAGVVCLVFGFIDIFTGAFLATLFALAGAALCGLAWNQIKG